MGPKRSTAERKARLPRRRGYALMLVLVFVVLFLALLGVVWRQMAAAVRVASVRAVQIQRDEGSIHSLARAMRLLETGLPPSNPYVCGTTIDTSGGSRSYTVTFRLEDETTWSVCSAPTETSETPSPMPTDFGPSP